ncbi:hypothetical protein DFH11DRAFT_1542729 [Phellopilus nigrolimitatus]|nr:hypothetical protein DFH11DRAFT_1542729 [Phellopilus nigrolimitatus]
MIVDAQSPGDIARQIDINYYAALVAFAILYYDYVLTFGDEVRFFWGRRANSVTLLFFLNRYLSVLGNVPVILQSFAGWSPEGCSHFQKYHQFFSVGVQIIVGIILIIRTYALYECNPRIAIIMAIFAFMLTCASRNRALRLVVYAGMSSVDFARDKTNHTLSTGLSGAWGGLLLFDSAIFTLTFFKAIGIWKLGTRGLIHVLVRDGENDILPSPGDGEPFKYTYFRIRRVRTQPILRGVSTTFANAVSVTMVSRLMLNLQNPLLFGCVNGQQTTNTNIGPFVATVVGRSAGSGTTYTEAYTDSDMDMDIADAYDGSLPRRSAVWYDRVWVTGERDVNVELEAQHTRASDIDLN